MTRLLATRPLLAVCLASLLAFAVLVWFGTPWILAAIVAPLAGCGVYGIPSVLQEVRYAD